MKNLRNFYEPTFPASFAINPFLRWSWSESVSTGAELAQTYLWLPFAKRTLGPVRAWEIRGSWQRHLWGLKVCFHQQEQTLGLAKRMMLRNWMCPQHSRYRQKTRGDAKALNEPDSVLLHVWDLPELNDPRMRPTENTMRQGWRERQLAQTQDSVEWSVKPSPKIRVHKKC